MSDSLNKVEEWTVRLLCAIALLFVGFAHQVPALASDPTDPARFAAYILPDGTLPTLCVTLTDTDGKANTDHKLHQQGCEACRISASVLLPVPNDVIGTAVAFFVRADTPIRAEAIHRQIYPPNTGPRAPPSDPTIA